MKKIFYFLASAIVALGAMACQNEVDENINPNETKEISFKVSFDEGTRIAMGELTGGKLPFEFDGKGLKGGPDSLYVGYSRYNGESYDTKRAFLVNSEENPYEFVADAKNQAILQELVGEENIYVVNRNNETVDPANGENGLLFKSEEFDLVAGENEVSLSLACSAFYFNVPEGSEAILSVNNNPIRNWMTGTPIVYGEGTHIVGYKSYNPAVTIAYSVNGVTVKEASLTLTNKVYNLSTLGYEFTTINTKEQLIAFAKHVNAGNSYEGKTVKLGNDIDLEGAAWTPIGNLDVIKYANVNSTFLGTFDGQGYTIKNFTIEQTGEAVGFFGAKFAGDIKDVKFDGVTVTGTHYGAVVVGWTDGAQRNADGQWNITGCEVTNSTVTLAPDNTPDNGDKAGAIVGYAYAINVTGNTVSKTTIQAYRDLGAIAGMAQENTKEATTVSGNTVGENVTVIVDNTVNYKNYTTAAQYNAGNYVGRISTNSVVENNTGEATIVLPKTAVEKLNEQIAAGESTITLTEDVTFEAGEFVAIPAGKTVTLDLGGKTMSLENTQTTTFNMIDNKGTLTLKNGTIEYADNTVLTADVNYASNTIHNALGATLTIENMVITNNSAESIATYGYPHVINNAGELIINSGTFSNNANYSTMRIWCTTAEGTSVTINGGTFNGSIDFQTPSNQANKGILTINGGTFNADTYTKSAVRLLGFGTDVDEMVANIKGGTFNGAIKANKYAAGEFNSKVFNITGGTFSSNPSEFVAENFLALKNYKTENMYDVVAVTASKWTMVGNFGGTDKWDSTSGYTLYQITNSKSNNLYTYVATNVELKKADYWKFLYNNSWNTSNGGWVGARANDNTENDPTSTFSKTSKYNTHHSWGDQKGNFYNVEGTYDIYLQVESNLYTEAFIWGEKLK